MEICPKVYFKVNKKYQVLIPVAGLIKGSFDKTFMDVNVLERNKKGYNEYTRSFIEACDASDVFYSDCYDYNPSLLTFNFASLHICNDSDYTAMSIEPSMFDAKKTYSSGMSNDVNNGSFMKKMIKDYPCPDINSGFYIEEKRWNILVRNILKHQNTMLVGPTGTGKTDVIIRICKALGIDCHIYDMGAMMDPLTDLLGSHRLENGSSKFDYAKFVEDVQKPGVILLDELSRAPLMTNNILFPCLDGRRVLPVEIADSNGPREIPIHPECTFIATANIGSEYSGTNEIDAALENRFMTIQVDYLPKSIESQILVIRTGCDEKAAAKIVGVANAIRERYLDGNLSKTISTRETLACGELMVDGFSLLESVNFAFCEKYSKYGENSEYDTVKKIMMGF